METEIIIKQPLSLVEPSLFLWMFAQTTAGNVFTDLLIYKTCWIIYEADSSNCTLLHTNSSSPIAIDLQHEIQPHISGVLIFKSVITILIPAFTGLFLGTWSDKYGRKPLLLMSYTGTCVTFLLLTILSNFDINTMVLMLVFLPFAMLGGFSSVILASLCYITDTTDPEKRAFKMVLIEATISIGSLLGIVSGPALLKYFGYSAVFGTSAVACFLATIYVFVFVKESVLTDEKAKYSEIFNVHVVKDLLMTISRQRVGFNRVIVWACTVCLVINMMVTDGDITIGYLFTSARLGWNVSDFANFTAILSVSSSLGAIIGTKLLKDYLGMPEMIVVIFTNMFNLANELIKAFTWHNWHMYLAAIVGMFGGVFSPMIRSVLSRSIPIQEVGKIFSVTVFVEMCAAFVASPLFNLVYSNYLPPMYPCPVWIMSAIFIAIMTIICFFIRLQELSYHDIEYNTQDNTENSVCE